MWEISKGLSESGNYRQPLVATWEEVKKWRKIAVCEDIIKRKQIYIKEITGSGTQKQSKWCNQGEGASAINEDLINFRGALSQHS